MNSFSQQVCFIILLRISEFFKTQHNQWTIVRGYLLFRYSEEFLLFGTRLYIGWRYNLNTKFTQTTNQKQNYHNVIHIPRWGENFVLFYYIIYWFYNCIRAVFFLKNFNVYLRKMYVCIIQSTAHFSDHFLNSIPNELRQQRAIIANI